jgi:hypothetical protein
VGGKGKPTVRRPRECAALVSIYSCSSTSTLSLPCHCEFTWSTTIGGRDSLRHQHLSPTWHFGFLGVMMDVTANPVGPNARVRQVVWTLCWWSGLGNTTHGLDFKLGNATLQSNLKHAGPWERWTQCATSEMRLKVNGKTVGIGNAERGGHEGGHIIMMRWHCHCISGPGHTTHRLDFRLGDATPQSKPAGLWERWTQCATSEMRLKVNGKTVGIGNTEVVTSPARR